MTTSDDIRIARLAEVGAVTGVVGLVSLGLMFAIEVPRGGPYRFGTLSDLCGAAFSALFIPVAARIAREIRDDGRVRLATRAAIVAAGAGTVLPLLLVGGALPFEVQTPLVVACIVVQSLWLVVIGSALQPRPGRERLGKVSRAVGSSFIAGCVAFGAGLMAPDGSPVRIALWTVGGIVGVVGYAGWPYWFHAVGRALRRPAANSTSRELAWTRP